MEPPLCTNGSAGYLMQLSVKISVGQSFLELLIKSPNCGHPIMFNLILCLPCLLLKYHVNGQKQTNKQTNK